MRACPFEDEERGLNSVDQKPVWLDVAFSMVVPFTGECMVLVLGRQWCLGLKQVYDGADDLAREFSFEKLAAIVVPVIGTIVDMNNELGLFQKSSPPVKP